MADPQSQQLALATAGIGFPRIGPLFLNPAVLLVNLHADGIRIGLGPFGGFLDGVHLARCLSSPDRLSAALRSPLTILLDDIHSFHAPLPRLCHPAPIAPLWRATGTALARLSGKRR